MKKLISEFYFDKAKYMVSDALGNQIILEIDYQNKKFKIAESNTVDREIRLLKMQVSSAAYKLFEKKHKVNFSDRIEVWVTMLL